MWMYLYCERCWTRAKTDGTATVTAVTAWAWCESASIVMPPLGHWHLVRHQLWPEVTYYFTSTPMHMLGLIITPVHRGNSSGRFFIDSQSEWAEGTYTFSSITLDLPNAFPNLKHPFRYVWTDMICGAYWSSIRSLPTDKSTRQAANNCLPSIAGCVWLPKLYMFCGYILVHSVVHALRSDH